MKERVRKEADDGSRTRDLELGKLALYQLSYVRAAAILRPRRELWPLPLPLAVPGRR